MTNDATNPVEVTQADRPDDDWFPCETDEPAIWGPWIAHSGGDRPDGIRTDLAGGKVDTVIYATDTGGGWGRNWSPFWPDIRWYRLARTHRFYREGRHRIASRATDKTLAAELRLLRRREIQAIGAGLSLRDWYATETAYNAGRDRLDRILTSLEGQG